ncbi:MAG: NUDIX hydrolase [Acidimicrobiia bacterium]|nr:NUDIX hydrolase [Acidimicrobiia bacterium]
MPPRLHRLLLAGFSRLPAPVRRRLVRWGSPSYTVGAICRIERADGRVLLIEQRYRRRWGLPGGLLARGERADDAVRREVREEVGLEIELIGEPLVVVDPAPRRVDVVFRAVPQSNAGLDDLEPCSPEIASVRWFRPDDLPDLQPETAGALSVLDAAGAASAPDAAGHGRPPAH